jgi:hypothetical protein
VFRGKKCIPFDKHEWNEHEHSEGNNPSIQADPRENGGDDHTHTHMEPEPELDEDSEAEIDAALRGSGDEPTVNKHQPEPRVETQQSARIHNWPRLNYQTIHSRGIDTARNEANAFLSNVPEPNTYHEAIRSAYAEEWCASMQKEYNQLVQKGVFRLETPLPDRKPIDCCWVYVVKCNAQQEVLKLKSRIIAKGFSQCPGRDYHKTHSSVVCPKALRTLIAIATH